MTETWQPHRTIAVTLVLGFLGSSILLPARSYAWIGAAAVLALLAWLVADTLCSSQRLEALVTQRTAALTERLRHSALYDPLTGLPNRACFMTQLEQAVKQTQDESRPSFAVLSIDIDRFKLINDSLGHSNGDRLLVAMAERIQECLEPTDVVARLGADEFTILATQPTESRAVQDVARKIQRRLRQPLELAGQEVIVTASIGIARSANGYRQASQVLRDADIALSRAKLRGRGHNKVFSRRMRYQAMETLQLETQLRHALERNQMRLYYQPIVELQSRRVRGFEALLRWFHPDLGLVSPDKFIHVAEETELIIPLGRWVLGQACRQARLWLEQPSVDADSFSVSVNVSAQQLKQPGFPDQVRRSLEESGLGAEHLKLEITENMIIEEAESPAATIRKLQAMGTRLHIDDFGTGYSSLHYLNRFDVEALKIDRTFVDTQIVGAIVNLAHGLGIDAIAEGVETETQAVRLQAMGCELAQGFYFSRPAEADEMEAFLNPQPSGLRPCLEVMA